MKALFEELNKRGWWQSTAQTQSTAQVRPLLGILTRLQTNVEDTKYHLKNYQRVFCISTLRLLQGLLDAAEVREKGGVCDAPADGNSVRRQIETRLEPHKWFEPLIFMLRAETNQLPELRVELFKTLAALINSSADASLSQFMHNLDQSKLLDDKGIPAEVEINESKERSYPLLRSFLEMMKTLVDNPLYWKNIGALASHNSTAQWPMKLLDFITDKVLKPHYGGRLYRDSGEKWRVAESAIATLYAIAMGSMSPLMPANSIIPTADKMTPQLRLVMKILDSPFLVDAMTFARANHVHGRAFQQALLVSLKFANLVLYRRKGVVYIGHEIDDIFQPRRVWSIIGLVGYRYDPEIVLEAVNTLTLLDSDDLQLPPNIQQLRESFREKVKPDGYEGDALFGGRHNGRVSWVILNLLLQQARAWHAKSHATRPELVHVMLGWPANEELGPPTFGHGADVGQIADYDTHTFRGTVESIAEADEGLLDIIIVEIIDRNYRMEEHEQEHFREAELALETIFLLYSDPRTHRAMRKYLTEEPEGQRPELVRPPARAFKSP